ncbi:heterokaryon incompatibility protein-domain-containing protein [Alternaria rosae]|uniref:heterokaryon incompatibility protein-domain-containing protein n=1 Tax=Alternaria rosae TaxID=1187941 RepID=UPI001E8DC032|nr:heterokaryon incompatibility protein-domain-containing protein [Alternaria rosae]KAH6865642.1 heterokaryon incompatibility protein-domain-containing protein [Alternaria rosae]
MYCQLDASRKEIRLLHVHPGAWNDDIACHLETVSLNDNPKFHAISYVWGDPTVTLPIRIDGESLEITRNLRNGLQRLRRTDKALIIYADAACINQSDLKERSEQVQLMGEIYSLAEETFIWLGYGRSPRAPFKRPATVNWTGDERDATTVDDYFKQSKIRDGRRGEQKEAEDVLGFFVYIRICGMDKHVGEIPFFTVENGRLLRKESWSAVIRATKTWIGNPWWYRIWVVQETVLARRATVVYCNNTMPWNTLIEAVQSITRHSKGCCRSLSLSLPTNGRLAWSQLSFAVHTGAVALQKLRQRGKRLCLSQVMRLVHLHEATNIRDNVFGVLGLVTDWQGTPPIIPDYSLSPKEVFVQATVRDIRGTRSLGALMGRTMAGVSGIPSWVVEISPKTPTQYAVAQLKLHRSALYSAAGATAAHIERRKDILTVDAFEPSQTISQVSHILHTERLTWKNIIDTLDTCYRMIEAEKERVFCALGNHTLEEALWRTLTTDSWEPLSSNQAASSNDSPRGNKSRRFGNANVTRLGRNLQSWCQARATNPNAAGSLHGEDLSDDRFFYETCFTSGFDRRFFITTDGRMGVGPPEMLPGDSIAILLGGNVPFCIRAVPDAPKGHYTLVGETYVHGLMDREGVPADWKEYVVKIHLH